MIRAVHILVRVMTRGVSPDSPHRWELAGRCCSLALVGLLERGGSCSLCRYKTSNPLSVCSAFGLQSINSDNSSYQKQ